MEVSGKVYRLSPGDIATDAKSINWSPTLDKVGYALRVNTAANKNLYLVEASQIQPGSHLFDQRGSNPTPLAGGIKSDTIQLLPQCLSHPQALFGLILKGINQRYPGHISRHMFIKSYGSFNRITHNYNQGMGHSSHWVNAS